LLMSGVFISEFRLRTATKNDASRDASFTL
jgi:hypothetical protein